VGTETPDCISARTERHDSAPMNKATPIAGSLNVKQAIAITCEGCGQRSRLFNKSSWDPAALNRSSI
jgi:hypothetical protein